MADKETLLHKRERLADETYEYFWNVCPELTAQWKQAMFTLPPSALRELAVEIQHLEAITNAANQHLSAAARAGALAGGMPPKALLDRALASMERLNEAADTMMRLLEDC
jgi:hypothetical protein